MARVVVILHLRLGQRGFLDRRPHDGLGALIQAAVHQELHELVSDHRLGMIVHCEIRLFPLAGDAQALELITLHVDPAFGEFAAFLTEGHHIDVVLVQTLGAVLLFDLPFDRQAVAIPPRHIARITAHHLLTAHHHILKDFVQRVADVQMAVGIGRAIMQRKVLASGLFAQPVIDADLFPTGQPTRLTLRQAPAHGKLGLRQKHSVTVVNVKVWRVGAHRMRSFGNGDCGRSLEAANAPCHPGALSGRRAANSVKDRKGCVHGLPYRQACAQGQRGCEGQ